MLIFLCIFYVQMSLICTSSHTRRTKSILVKVQEDNALTEKSNFAQIPSVISRNIMEFLSVSNKPTRASRAFRMAAFESISDDQWSNIMANYLDASFLIKSEMEDWILSAWNYFDESRKYHISNVTRSTIKYPDYDTLQDVLDDIYFPFDERALQRTSLVLYHTTPEWTGRIMLNAISLSLFNESVSASHLHESFMMQFDVKELIGCLNEMKRFCMHYFDLNVFWDILKNIHSDLSWQWHDLMENTNRRVPIQWMTTESMTRMSIFWISWLKYTNFGWKVVSVDTQHVLSMFWNLWGTPEPLRLAVVFQHHQYLDGERDKLYNNSTYLSKFDI